MSEVFKVHSEKQALAFNSNKKITAVITGVQWGKSSVGSLWIRRHIFEHLAAGTSFLIVAPTFRILEQSTLPAFLRTMEAFGSFTRHRAVFTVDAGHGDADPKVYFRTATEPDSIVGMTNVRAIWGDEAGKFPLYFWENLIGRSAFKDCPIMLTTSPYSMNWLYRDIIKPTKEGLREDVTLIQASSDENPYFPKDVFERNKKIMDPRRFNMMFGGNFDRMQGLVYDCFDEVENQCQPFKLPDGTRYYGGIDWGFTDPAVIKIRAITPAGQHYSVSEFYKSGIPLSEIVSLCKQKKEVFSVRQFYCDPSQPGAIEELCRNGVPAVKANNDITRGIGIHYQLLKERRLKYFAGMNPHTLNELETYHYPEPKDLGPDDNSKDQKPVDAENHCSDCDRYISIMTANMASIRQPRVPEEARTGDRYETQQKRLNRLMKRKSAFGEQTENWE